MPVYCYLCPTCGTTKEVSKPMSECDLPELCPVDAFVMRRDFNAEHGGRRRHEGWPMVSEMAGINPAQIGEYQEFDKKMGVPTDYTPEGDVVWRDRAHRKKYCEAHHLYDRNAGYSDPQPKNR